VTASVLQLFGMLAACGGAAVALLAHDPRLRYGAALVALVAAPALVAGDVWHSARFVDLRHHPATLAAAILGTALAVAGGAVVFRRIPWLLPVSLFAALSLRVPVHLGGQTAHLLVPLYVVIAAGLVCFAYGALVGERARAADGRSEGGVSTAADWPAAEWLRRALAATLVVYAIQSAYTVDVSNAIENASFFLVPFAVMFVLLTEVRWTRQVLGYVLVGVSAMGLLFAAVAFGEYAARDLILSRGNLLESNQLHLYFRVNSLFYDPNVFGRYMALTLVALGAYLAWTRGTRAPVLAAIVSGILLGALAFSYSITSFVALVAGMLVVAALRWSVRWALAGGAAILICGGIFVLVSGTGQTDFGSGESLNAASSGRVNLVKGGTTLARDRPLWGWGSGSFGAAFTRHIHRGKTTESHNEPITVAAEQGGIGLAVYLTLVVLALIVLFSGASASAVSAATAACFVAMVVHSLGYAGFTTDPATWALLGLGLAVRRTLPVAAADAVDDSSATRSPREPRPAAV
jgi:O-antigen ligase/polysaccharide polymerase Wzy-like membrane protein